LGDKEEHTMHSILSLSRWSVLVLAVAGASCATTHSEFTPTERVEGTTVEGMREAFYDLATGPTPSEAKIFSHGADLINTDQGKAVAIAVGITIDNGSNEPVDIAPEQFMLESVQTSKVDVPPNIHAYTITGQRSVQPHQTGTAVATFLVPGVKSTSWVKAFRVRWSVRTQGRLYTEFTPFVQEAEIAYVPVYGYYYPYFPADYPFYAPYYYPYSHITVVHQYPRRIVVHGHH
jgi:hypothetical protein